MRLHGHYLNGRSDVLQLAETQTVGGCMRRKPAFLVESWQASPSFCQQLRGLIRCTERADDALVSGGSKQENEFHRATQPLCIFKMV